MESLLWVIVGIVIGWIANRYQNVFHEQFGNLEDMVQKLIGKHPPKDAVEVLLEYKLEGHKDAKTIHIAGGFNNWLNNQSGLIVRRKRYSMQKTVSDDKVVWKKKIWLLPGNYEFKFVANKNDWIHWNELIGYPRAAGNPPGGGSNCLLVVKR